MRVLITGGSGFIGRHLAAALRQAGHEARTTSRTSGDVIWDPVSGPLPAAALEAVDGVVHLAGESVGEGRWSRKKMARIRESRETGTRNLVSAKPRLLVCASAIGYYGNRGEEVLTEESPPGDDFLAQVCQAWEAEARKVEAHDGRWVSIRTGIALGSDGGALPRMLTPFKMCMGGPIAGGKQWMSWVHVEDLVRLYLHALTNDSVRGPINGTAPAPVTNREFSRSLGGVLGRPSFMPMPYFMLRLAVGKFARALASSQRVEPRRARELGFEFRYPELEAALRDILAPPGAN